jgi:signal transduction histidine kinase
MGLHDDHETVGLLSALLRVSLAINASLDLPDILGQVVTATRELVACDAASLVLWDGAAQRFEPGAMGGLPEGAGLQPCYEGDAARWVVEHARPLVVSDTRTTPFDTGPLAAEHRVRALAIVPLQAGGKLLGLLFALARQVRAFDQGELAVMQVLADISAVAVRNTRLVDQLRQMNEFRQITMRMAAHDLRNPLTEAVGYLAMLMQEVGTLTPEEADHADRAQRALDRIAALIDGILAHERVTSGEMERQPCDLNAIAYQVAGDFRLAALRKSHQLTVEPTPAPLTVLGDALLLRQALGNLVGNAIKFTPPCGAITLRTWPEGQECAISVVDTGPGMGADEQVKLFEPFARLKSAGAQRGSGLGLSLVKAIIDRHSGRVTVRSAPGEGTGFTLWLPAAPDG